MERIIGYTISFSLIAAAIFGWCYNIYKLFYLDSMSGELVLRGLGVIIPPLGVIMGYV